MAEVHVSDISLERREHGRQTLRTLELQLKSSRKERFQMKKQHTEQLSQRQKMIVELRRELDKDHKQHDLQLSTKNRIAQKLHDIFNGLPGNADIDNSIHTMKVHFQQRRPEVQLEALSNFLRASKANELSKMSHKIDLQSVSMPVFSATQELMRLEAGLVDGASDIGRLREEMVALQQCDDTHADAKVQDMATRIAGVRAQASASKAMEIQNLQQRFHELEQQLEEETMRATHVAMTAAAVAQVTPTPASRIPTDLNASAVGNALSTIASRSTTDLVAPIVSNSLPTTGDTLVNVSAASHMLAAKGKGKGKGKNSIPKCPPVMKAPPRGKGALVSSSSGSNLLNLHWKVLNAEPALDSVTPSSDGFLAKTAQLAASFATSSSPSLVRAARRQELRLPEVSTSNQAPNDSSGSVPCTNTLRRETIFSSPTDVKIMPTPLLETYFKSRATVVKLPGSSSESLTEPNETRKPLFDRKFLQMLGIMLQKQMMNHKDLKGFANVLSIKRDVLQCDYDSLGPEKLGTIYTVLREPQNGALLRAFVKEKGEEALLRLENSLEHRLVHELLKVPQIDERLECMLFQTQFHHLLGICHRHLAVLKQALDVLDSKRDSFSKFFNIALKFGQGMNRDCRAPQATRGFTLSSFDKMVQTRSTKSPKHNVLHFVLALMDPVDLDQLFTRKDAELLGKAKSIKSYIAYQDCIELVQGFSGMREICDTGNYKSRSSKGGLVKMEQKRKTMCPGMRPTEVDNEDDEHALDNDDRFHNEMKGFVDDNLDDIQKIAKDCFNVFRLYKELAIFFDDVRSVYPPPRGETDVKVDLVVIFHHLAKHVIAHREEMRQDHLRDLVGLVLDVNIATQQA